MNMPRRATGWKTRILFVLFFLAESALAAVLGVDYGQEYIKAALVKPGIPIDIVLTKDTKRKDVAAVAFKDRERLYGSDAVAYSTRAPGKVYSSLKSLLGVNTSASVVSDFLELHPALDIEETERSTVAFSGDPTLDVESLVAMQFANFRQLASSMAREPVRDAVITCPPFFTQAQRMALIDAAEVAGLRVLGLINDGLAVALNYASGRSFSAQPVYHVIYDMGAGSTSASVVSFKASAESTISKSSIEVDVKGVGWNTQLGGDAFNARLVKLLGDKFESKHSVQGVRQNHRAVAKLQREATRVRHILSANSQASTSVESLYDDLDFRDMVTREEFEEINKDYMAAVEEPIKDALEKSGIDIVQIESFILTGGSVRVPFVQRKLIALVGEEKISKNVNADEAAVMGATFRGAALSQQFKVKDIKVSEVAGQAIEISYPNESGKVQRQGLFRPSSIMGREKYMSMKHSQDFSIQANTIGDPNTLEYSITGVATAKKNMSDSGCLEESIRLGVDFTSDLMLNVSAQFICEEFAKENIADKVKGFFGRKDDSTSSESTSTLDPSDASDADASPSTTSKPVKKQRVSQVSLQTKTTMYPFRPLNREAKRSALKRLQALDDIDRDRVARDDARNELEGFTYRAREMLSSSAFVEVSDDEQRDHLEDAIRNTSDWMSSEADKATHRNFKDRLNSVRKLQQPILNRQNELKNRDRVIDQLRLNLNRTEEFLVTAKDLLRFEKSASSSSEVSATETNTPPESNSNASPTPSPPFSLYEQEDIDEVSEQLAEIRTWFDSKLSKQQELQLWENPVLKVRDMEAQIRALQDMVGSLIGRGKKRKPKRQSAKKTSTNLSQTIEVDLPTESVTEPPTTSESGPSTAIDMSVSSLEEIETATSQDASTPSSTASASLASPTHDEL